MSSHEKSEIAALVTRCYQGDKEAWTKLMEMVSPVIFSICRSMNLSREESFDIFGQVSYLLLRNLKNLRSPEKLLSYITTMTRREVYSLTRRAKLFERLTDLGYHLRNESSEPQPDEAYEKSRQEELLMEAILLLPRRDYELIKSLFLDTSEPSYEEISKKLGIPVSSIGPTRARSLAKLKRILKRKGFEF